MNIIMSPFKYTSIERCINCVVIFSGVHDDHLYVDVKRATVETLDNYVEVWPEDNKEPGYVYGQLKDLRELILEGIL